MVVTASAQSDFPTISGWAFAGQARGERVGARRTRGRPPTRPLWMHSPKIRRSRRPPLYVHPRHARRITFFVGLRFRVLCLVEGERGSARRVGKLGTSGKMRRTSPTTMQEKREQIEKHSEFRVSTCPSVLRRCMPCWTSIYRVQISNAVLKTLPLCTIRAQADGRTSLAHT